MKQKLIRLSQRYVTALRRRELQNEIVQTLLGINVRLLSLKQEARNNTRGFKNEIASTQRLVVKSVQSVRNVAREFGNL